MTVRDFSHVHSSWEPVLEPHRPLIDSILSKIQDVDIAPPRDLIFASLAIDIEKVRCVIIGQDPYPTKSNAHGLAFSIPESVQVIPASLRNIFKELQDDIGVEPPTHGNLSAWVSEGVLLLNRVLTTRIGQTEAHTNLGWQIITEAIARESARRNPVAILWGKKAQELSHLFDLKIESVHPSPLSAYRGFFGSKPFSRTNEMLLSTGRSAINWNL